MDDFRRQAEAEADHLEQKAESAPASPPSEPTSRDTRR
jgi:hypothetical protein